MNAERNHRRTQYDSRKNFKAAGPQRLEHAHDDDEAAKYHRDGEQRA